MIAQLKSISQRFREDISGHATIEFAVLVPVFLTLLLSSVEAGMLNFRTSFLERSLDIVVREIRLGTGFAPSHSEMRDRICEEARYVPDCSNNLLLEMVRIDPRAWVGIPSETICTNRAEEVQPVTQFISGSGNDLMIVRACLKIEPLFPTSGLGRHLQKDSAGDVSIVAMTAFVQEPE